MTIFEKIDKTFGNLTKKATKSSNMESMYDWVGDFSEGLATVKLNDKYGYIDKTGREVIPCKYDGINDFKEGLAKVQLNGKIGFIDKTGKEVIPCIFDGAIYDNKMLYARFNGKYGCVNQLGDIIVPFIYDTMPFFEDGQIKITNDDISIIYSLEGEIVF